jgi:hypothetical protein
VVGLSDYTLNKEMKAIISGKRNSGKPFLQGKHMEGSLSGSHKEAASSLVVRHGESEKKIVWGDNSNTSGKIKVINKF